MRLIRALRLLACAPIFPACAADLGPSGDTVARAVSIGPIAVADAGSDTDLRWAAWSNATGASRWVRLALFNMRKSPAEAVWSQTWPDAYDPRLVAMTPWVHAGHPVYALTLRFGAEAEQVDLIGLDADGKPAHLAEKLGAGIGFILASEKAAVVIYQTPQVALVPTCFNWRDGSELAATPCIGP